VRAPGEFFVDLVAKIDGSAPAVAVAKRDEQAAQSTFHPAGVEYDE
jgi:hypothetical protein